MVLAEQMEVGANSATDKIRDLMGVYDDAGARADAAARQMESFKAAIKGAPRRPGRAMVAKLAQQMGYMGIEAGTAQRIVDELSVITETHGSQVVRLRAGTQRVMAKGFCRAGRRRPLGRHRRGRRPVGADARDRSAAGAEAKLRGLVAHRWHRSRPARRWRSLGGANDRLRDSLDGARTAQRSCRRRRRRSRGDRPDAPRARQRRRSTTPKPISLRH